MGFSRSSFLSFNTCNEICSKIKMILIILFPLEIICSKNRPFFISEKELDLAGLRWRGCYFKFLIIFMKNKENRFCNIMDIVESFFVIFNSGLTPLFDNIIVIKHNLGCYDDVTLNEYDVSWTFGRLFKLKCMVFWLAKLFGVWKFFHFLY